MSNPSISLRQWYWKARNQAQSLSLDLSFDANLLRSGIAQFSETGKYIRYWETYVKWLRFQAIQAGYTLANRNNLSKYKTSDTLFILGSGPSINEINEEEWGIIAKYDSIGFNYFMAHPFVPTYYHMELPHKDIGMFRECYAQRQEAYKNIPFMVNYHFIAKDYKKGDLDFIHNKLITVARMYPHAKTNELSRIFRFLYRHIEPVDDCFLINYRGSLSLMISLAIALGYKKIILTGIDLKTSDYFFCNKRYACVATQTLTQTRCAPASEVSNSPHATADPSFIPSTVTIDRLMHIYDEAVLKERGIKIFVYSEHSMLHPAFPAWSCPG